MQYLLLPQRKLIIIHIFILIQKYILIQKLILIQKCIPFNILSKINYQDLLEELLQPRPQALLTKDTEKNKCKEHNQCLATNKVETFLPEGAGLYYVVLPAEDHDVEGLNHVAPVVGLRILIGQQPDQDQLVVM